VEVYAWWDFGEETVGEVGLGMGLWEVHGRGDIEV